MNQEQSDALGRYEAAIADYDEAICLKPDFAAAYHNRGNAKQALERYGDAIADYNQAILLKPDFAAACVSNAQCDNNSIYSLLYR